MKRSALLLIALCSLFPVSAVCAAETLNSNPPTLPCARYGRVTLAGADVTDGTVVSAWIAGVKYAEAPTQTFEGHSVYDIEVPGDDTSTLEIEGGAEGDTISFMVGATTAAQTAIWHEGATGSLDLTAPPPTAPSVVGAFPNSGSSAPGVAQDFWLTVMDANGREDISQAMFLMNTSISGANAVYLTYDRGQNKLWLRNDAGTTNLGGFAPGSANSTENAQAALDYAHCGVSGTGTDLILHVRLTFKQAFGGMRFLYGKVTDLGSLADGWDTLGLWSISGSAPTLVSVTPGTGTTDVGVTRVFTVTATDADTANDIHYTFLLINSIIDRPNSVYLTYDLYENKVFLRNDSGFVNGTGYAPGTANTLENSQATIDVSQCAVAKAGNQLTVRFAVRFKPVFSGLRDVYGQVVDYTLHSTGWTKYGTWTINGQPPAIALLAPASGSSAANVAQTFSIEASDPDGYGNVRTINWLVGPAINAATGVYVSYDRLLNKVYLRDDAGTTNLGGFSPGTANTIENSRAIVEVVGCSAGPHNGNLALNLRIRFKAGFAGSQNQYVKVQDYGNQVDGWKQKGTWTVTP